MDNININKEIISDAANELSAQLEISERRRRDVQRLSGVGFWELNHVTDDLYWSEEVFAIYEIDGRNVTPTYELFLSLIYEPEKEFVHKAYRESVVMGNQYDIRYRVKAKNSIKWIEARGMTYYTDDGQPERSIGSVSDISEIIMVQEKIKQIAYHDELTGLPNRKLFSEKLTEAIKFVDQNSVVLAVLFIDLDDFKLVNDRYGHDIGDELLVSVAKALTPFMNVSCVFARIGGDEFAGFIVDRDETEIDEEVQKIKQAIDGIHHTQAHSFDITASIGVSIYSQGDHEPDILLRHADQAMYEVKEQGKSGIRYFDTVRFQSNWSRRHLLADIEHALKNSQFELFYQPRVRLQDGQLFGAEALLRWNTVDGAVPPTVIVEAIKNTSLEWELDKWVIKQVLLQSKAFKKEGLAGPFSLNINPTSLQNFRFPSLVKSLLLEADVSGDEIEIEILEVESIKDFDVARQVITECNKMGVKFSIDDFGTGYSSLTYFHALPIEKLKIDQLFIKSINTDEGSLLLVKSILAIANENNTSVVAEGVETADIAQTLADLQCEYAQGYGIAMPMPIKEYIEWTKNRGDWMVKPSIA